MADTCKECEHYKEIVEKRVVPCGKKAVMFCPKLKGSRHSQNEVSSDGYSSNIVPCVDFIPKEPEVAVEKRHDNCRHYAVNLRTTEPCETCFPEDKHRLWEPIPKKLEAVNLCRKCNNHERKEGVLYCKIYECPTFRKDCLCFMPIPKEPEVAVEKDMCGDHCPTEQDNPLYIWCDRFNRRKHVTDKACKKKVNEQPAKKPGQQTAVTKSVAEKERDYEAHVSLLNARLRDQKEDYRRSAAEARMMAVEQVDHDQKRLQAMQAQQLKLAARTVYPPMIFPKGTNLDGLKSTPTQEKKENKMEPESCLNCRKSRPRDEDKFYCDYLQAVYRNTTNNTCNRYKRIKPKPLKLKENTMLKKVRHIARMLMLISCSIHLYQMVMFANPKVFWAAETFVSDEWNADTPLDCTSLGQTAGIWIGLLGACAIVCVAVYTFHRLTKWTANTTALRTYALNVVV